ncbi:MAG: DUF711 family protein [Campylobacterota bacterium]|nr:DUF711 family protein [Campylobacterota bacterium]
MSKENMVIRSITYTIDLNNIESKTYLEYVEKNINKIKEEYCKENIEIRTIRFNIISIKELQYSQNEILLNKIASLSLFTQRLGLRWFNISFDLIDSTKEYVNQVCELSLEILKEYENAFVNLIIASNYINNYAAYKAAQTINKVSKISENGIDNFRFGVSLNIQPNTPFFPFSYSNTIDSFSIAVETTKSVVKTIKEKFNHDYVQLKEDIIQSMMLDLKLYDSIASSIMDNENIQYNGQDISLSPYPDENISVIEILNLLGLDNFGSNGTQFLTSYLTSILKEAIQVSGIKAIGFNGVMYSLLEDHLMCEAHDKKNFSIDSIILYSTVCGCGLDMVPLPGNSLSEEIASMILDVATTSIKLNKPLGVRVLPIPNKLENEKTNLKLDFLTNTLIPEVKHIHIDHSLFEINRFYVKAK